MDPFRGRFQKSAEPPLTLYGTFPGSVAVAKVAEHDVVIVSVYAVITHGYADTTVHRILSDLMPLIDSRHGRRVIMAGDFNITTQWSAKHRQWRGSFEQARRRDQLVFDRFKALGFTNVVGGPEVLAGCGCADGDQCRHVQTLRQKRSTFPWQADYVFVSEDLLAEVRAVRVVDDEAAWELSDHCPVFFEVGV
jgi:endonuclease/exonuclease/phosphatase family metal-dependent hydrolase